MRVIADGIADPEVHDSWVRLLDSNGDIVAENDDGGGDPGSATTRDSSTVYVVEETGSYYILEGQWSPDVEGDGWSEAVPEGSTYAWTEAPSGAAGYYLVSRGEKTPHRMKLRSASFNNVQVLSEMLPGQLVADMVAILGSMFFVVGDVDK